MGHDLGVCLHNHKLDPRLAAEMDVTLSAMAAVAAGCERIKNTPIPFVYTLLLHRTAWLYCFLLPFGLVDAIGSMTPFVVAIVAYTFFGLDAQATRSRSRSGWLPIICLSMRSAERSKSACSKRLASRTYPSPSCQ